MKKCICMALCLILLFACCLPIFAANDASLPQDPFVAELWSTVFTSVGNDTPGAAVLSVRGAEIEVMEGFGYADMQSGALVTADTAFELGELTSLFTVLTILCLIEDGTLQSEESIERYLPEDFYEKLALNNPVSLRQLLYGIAGFEGRSFDCLLGKPTHMFESLPEALLADVPRQTVGDAAHPQYAYSSFGISLAAYVAESALGIPFEQLVQSRVLAPVGMTSTVLLPTKATTFSEPALGYIANGDRSFAAAKNGGRTYSGLPYALGAVSTLADLSQLFTALFSRRDIFSQAVYNRFTTPLRMGDALFEQASAGLAYRDHTLQLTGNTLCFGAALAMDPQTKSAMLVLTNAANSSLLSLPAKTFAKPDPYPFSHGEGELPELKLFRGSYLNVRAEQHSFVGKYKAISEGVLVSVEKQSGTILVGDRRLTQIGNGIFADVGENKTTVAVQFLFDDEGDVIGFISAQGESFVAVPFYAAGRVAQILYYVLLGLAAFFLVFGLYHFLRFFFKRNELPEALLRFFEGLCALLMSAFVFWQILLCRHHGAAAISTGYSVLSVLALIFCIGVLVSLSIDILTSLFDKDRFGRALRTSVFLVAYVFLAAHWGLILF